MEQRLLDRVVYGQDIGDPVRCLALAVLHKAFEDRAWGWMLGDPIDPEFVRTCEMAQLDPEWVRQAARRHGATAERGDPAYERITLAVARGPGRPRKDGRLAHPHLRLVVWNN